MNAPQTATADIAEKKCPHCQDILKKYSVSPFTFSDGLGFGSPVLQICFNDQCPLYVKGWIVMNERYGRDISQRYYYNPFDRSDGVIPVGSSMAMRGDIID